MKQNNSMDFSGHSFLKVYNENWPPDPPTPNPDFPGFSLSFAFDLYILGLRTKRCSEGPGTKWKMANVNSAGSC